MRCDVLAVGTELILGDIVDTNAAWIGQQLAEAGIDSCLHLAVGDNLPRMVDALRLMLARSDAVLVCGGIGPTPDDVTREMVAEVMGVPLERREDLVDEIRALFAKWNRAMPANNERQGDVPVGGHAHQEQPGDRPRAHLPVGQQGRLRGAGRSLRDDGHGQRGRRPRPAGTGGGAGHHRVPQPEDLGHTASRAWPR